MWGSPDRYEGLADAENAGVRGIAGGIAGGIQRAESHWVQLRTNASWSMQNNGFKVVGRLEWYSSPATVPLRPAASSRTNVSSARASETAAGQGVGGAEGPAGKGGLAVEAEGGARGRLRGVQQAQESVEAQVLAAQEGIGIGKLLVQSGAPALASPGPYSPSPHDSLVGASGGVRAAMGRWRGMEGKSSGGIWVVGGLSVELMAMSCVPILIVALLAARLLCSKIRHKKAPRHR